MLVNGFSTLLYEGTTQFIERLFARFVKTGNQESGTIMNVISCERWSSLNLEI